MHQRSHERSPRYLTTSSIRPSDGFFMVFLSSASLALEKRTTEDSNLNLLVQSTM